VDRIVDVDVHPSFPEGFGSVIEYAPRDWQRRLQYLTTQRPGNAGVLRYPHPLGPNSVLAEAIPPGGGRPGSDPEFLLADLVQRHGIDIALLVPLDTVQAIAAPDPERSAVIVSAYNDYLIDRWLGDRRIRLALTVSPMDPMLAAREIHRHGDNPGVAAVFIQMINKRLGDRHYHPIYEAAIEHGLPIVSHIGGGESGHITAPQLAGGLPESYAEWRVDWQQIAQSSLSSLIFRGTFERYPTLKVVFLEFGFTWALPHTWRMNKAWRELRAEIPWVRRWPSEYVHEHIRFASQPIEEPLDRADANQLTAMIEDNFADLLVYSSDYPHWDADEPAEVLTSLREETKRKIFSANADAVLRL
jgi:predicted TIM-barrel fold metal-dependent hydrolase